MSEASEEFVAALEAVMESLQLKNRGLLCDWKLTPVRAFILRWLSKSPDANMSSLARLLEVRPQTLTPIVDSLEKEGLIRRVRSAEDRRELLLELTAKGERLLESLRASIRESLAAAPRRSPRHLRPGDLARPPTCFGEPRPRPGPGYDGPPVPPQALVAPRLAPAYPGTSSQSLIIRVGAYGLRVHRG